MPQTFHKPALSSIQPGYFPSDSTEVLHPFPGIRLFCGLHQNVILLLLAVHNPAFHFHSSRVFCFVFSRDLSTVPPASHRNPEHTSPAAVFPDGCRSLLHHRFHKLLFSQVFSSVLSYLPVL